MRLLTTEELVAVVWSGACFCFGVAWAAYRAVGWVERMRTWAGVHEVGRSFSGAPLVGAADSLEDVTP